MAADASEVGMSPEDMSEPLIQSLVFETFGLRRFTQDSPIKPDVWLRFLRFARKGWGKYKVPLILTPTQPMAKDGKTAGHAGQLAEKVREAILKRPRKDLRRATREEVENELAAERTELEAFRIAATSKNVAVDMTFDQMISYLLPLTDWWRRQTEFSNLETLFNELNKEYNKDTPMKDALLRLNNTEFFRFAALASIVAWLQDPSKYALNIVDALAITKKLTPAFQQRTGFGERDNLEIMPKELRSENTYEETTLKDLETLWTVYEKIAPKQQSAKDKTIRKAATEDISIWAIQVNRLALKQEKKTTSKSPIPGQSQQAAKTIKADAARQLFNISTAHLAWGIIDTGIDAQHPAFRVKPLTKAKAKSAKNAGVDADANDPSRIVATLDFTILQDLLSESTVDALMKGHFTDGKATAEQQAKWQSDLMLAAIEIREGNVGGRQLDWSVLENVIRYETSLCAPCPENQHGTHVTGILAGNLPEGLKPDEDSGVDSEPFVGVCPDIKIYDLRVFSHNDSDTIGNDEFTVLAALDYIAWLNRDPMRPTIHGVNLSLAIKFEVNSYACGRTPVCDACDRLVWNGTVVVAAAGNFGFDATQGNAEFGVGYRSMSITDPGNAQYIITVGSTHHSEPYTYGVSYFSSRGPTGDGRMKPDLVAPGEKIRSTVPGNQMWPMDGTSMAAPHVSGACALLMGRHSELIGEPERIKKILMDTATDLGRERHFQGAGLVDALRALQSV